MTVNSSDPEPWAPSPEVFVCCWSAWRRYATRVTQTLIWEVLGGEGLTTLWHIIILYIRLVSRFDERNLVSRRTARHEYSSASQSDSLTHHSHHFLLALLRRISPFLSLPLSLSLSLSFSVTSLCYSLSLSPVLSVSLALSVDTYTYHILGLAWHWL